MKSIVISIAAAVVLCGAVAFAQNPTPPAQNPAPAKAGKGMMKRGRGACKADAEALCKDVKKGQGRIFDCLANNVDKVQDAKCKERISSAKARRDEVKAACQSDIDANCKGKEFGTGLAKCLHHNRKSLSDACKAAMKKGHGKGDTGKEDGGTGENEE